MSMLVLFPSIRHEFRVQSDILREIEDIVNKVPLVPLQTTLFANGSDYVPSDLIATTYSLPNNIHSFYNIY